MFKVKKQFSSIIYICLISFIGLLFIINNNKVMAMNKNNYERINNKDKGKKIANNEPILIDVKVTEMDKNQYERINNNWKKNTNNEPSNVKHARFMEMDKNNPETINNKDKEKQIDMNERINNINNKFMTMVMKNNNKDKGKQIANNEPSNVKHY
ncbi:hypothetical protein FEF22_002120 [Texas Phoenix palm phytoplasma]|uniref:Sequence-variable mosaic (SVM) signal sequence domain-containing protein n=1 Tax=Texas Phoenix palm phytoplasma TaxID=176709 RepID=A0ABS5BJM5_9MOLU|nr:SVM family protein [Texas Phoenix palm phytoplasma]MBP3059561.1 hypothetical protein [Texas Phoenix palm phytoplasma]